MMKTARNPLYAFVRCAFTNIWLKLFETLYYLCFLVQKITNYEGWEGHFSEVPLSIFDY